MTFFSKFKKGKDSPKLQSIATYDAFISYAREDEIAIGSITQQLATSGITYWIDKEQIQSGQDWWERITDGIRRSNKFVFFASPHSKQSRSCRLEVEYADEHSKKLLRYELTENTDFSDFNETVFHLHYVTDNIRQLADDIKKDFSIDSLNSALLSKYSEWQKNERKKGYLLNEEATKAITRAGYKPSQFSRQVEEYVKNSIRRIHFTRIFRVVISAVMLLTVLGLLLYKNIANLESKRVFAGELITASQNAFALNLPQRAILYNLEAIKVLEEIESNSLPSAYQSLYTLLIGTQGQSLSSFFGPVNSIAISEKTGLLAASSDDWTIGIWDLENPERPKQEINKHNGWVRDVEFSPDGKYMASAGADQSLFVWTISEGNVDDFFYVFGVGRGLITSLAFSPNSQYLASAGVDGIVIVVDISNLKTQESHPTQELIYHNGEIWDIEFSPDGKWIAVASADGIISIWAIDDLSHPKIVLNGQQGGVIAIDFSRDGKYLASSGTNAKLILWRFLDKEIESELSLQTNISSLVFTHDSQFLITGGEDGLIRVWNINSLNGPSVILRGHEGSIRDLAVTSDSTTLFSAGSDGTLRANNLNDYNSPFSVYEFTGEVWASLFIENDRKLLAATSNAISSLRIVPTNQDILGETLGLLDGTTDWPYALAISPKGAIAAGGDQTIIRVWSEGYQSDSPILLSGHHEMIRGLAFNFAGNLLASLDYDRNVILWDLANPNQVTSQHLFNGEENVYIPLFMESPLLNTASIAFNSQGTLLAWTSFDSKLYLFPLGDTSLEPTVLSINEGRITSFAFSPIADALTASTSDGLLLTWDVNNLKAAPREIESSQRAITSVAYSPNGLLFASSSSDGSINIRDTKDMKLISIFHLQDGAITGISFSSDNNYLISGSTDFSLIKVLVNLEDLVDIACGRAGRNLTREEAIAGVMLDGHKTCPAYPTGIQASNELADHLIKNITNNR